MLTSQNSNMWMHSYSNWKIENKRFPKGGKWYKFSAAKPGKAHILWETLKNTQHFAIQGDDAE